MVLHGYGGFERKEDAIKHAKTWIDSLYKKEMRGCIYENGILGLIILKDR